jgi:hypothetical protein
MLKRSLAFSAAGAPQSGREIRLVLMICALAIALATVLASTFEIPFITTALEPRYTGLTDYFFREQDRLWLLMIAAMLLGLTLLPLPMVGSPSFSVIAHNHVAAVIILALAVLIVGALGTEIVFHGYHLTRDEFLAEFDAKIFASGKFEAPIDPTWQPLAAALEPRFMLSIPRDLGFVSAYLPVNAAFRALVGLVVDSNWTSPLFAAIAALATFGVARLLWPNRIDAAFISALLVATSSQVLVTSMTSYAMTAHLALNMIWLWSFLRDDKSGHGAAIATGFLATGIHQLVFHPLFAAPFIARLWLNKRRSLAYLYVVAYALICLFWIGFWQIILSWQDAPPQVSDETSPVFFLVKVFVLLEGFQWAGFGLMLKNMLRFIAWQSPALLPLAILSHRSIRRGSGIARELAAGLGLTAVAMFVLFPYQGHGWGYRYFHGLIGSAALLAGYGWITLSNNATKDELRAARTMFAICTAAAVFILLPARAIQAHDFAAPYVRAARAIAQAPTDIVIVDESGLLFAEDLVRNDPFLRNRPKVLDLTNLDKAKIAKLCSLYSISLFARPQGVAFGIAANDLSTKPSDKLRVEPREALSRTACRVEPVADQNEQR